MYPQWCSERLGVTISSEQFERLAAAEEPESLSKLDELGQVAARKLIEPSHFPGAFELVS
jgi:hypothetical protein